METNNTDGHKQKMPTPSFHKFRNHGPQQHILTNCKTEFKRISTFVQLVLLTVVEIRSDPYTSVAQVKKKGRRHKAQPSNIQSAMKCYKTLYMCILFYIFKYIYKNRNIDSMGIGG